MMKEEPWSSASALMTLISTALIGVLITYASVHFARNIEQGSTEQRFSFAREEMIAAIENRMRSYESVLRSGNSVFLASDEVTRRDWREFHNGLQLDRHFPGIQALGYSEWVKPSELEAYEARVRAEGFPTFHLKPQGLRSEYTSIIYIEPMDLRNRQAFGYDMWSQETRREAMSRARDTGEITISGPVRLVQEIDSKVQAGILMYLPRYATEFPATLEDRRAQNLGFVYGAFRMDDLMEGIIGSDLREIEIEVFDTTRADAANLLYQSDKIGSDEKTSQTLEGTDRLEMYGRSWEIVSRSKPSLFARDGDVGLTEFFLLGSAGASIFIFVLVAVMLNTRRRAAAIAEEITQDLDDRTKELSASLCRQIMIEDELRVMVTKDVLTGLANRTAYGEWLEDVRAHLEEAEGSLALGESDTSAADDESGQDSEAPQGPCYGLMILDLDRFKTVNDTLGHLKGDELLAAVGNRLHTELPSGLRIARLGGDEFAILVEEDEERSRALALAEDIIALFQSPFACTNRPIKTACSIGIAFIDADCTDPHRAMSHADIALYRAKAMGRAQVRIFDKELEADMVRRASIEDALDGALDRREFHLEYQPKLDANGGTVVGAEVLLRWIHPELGFVPPDMFIQTAEETGDIEAISEWILDETCRQLRSWMDDGVTDIPLAINLSSQQLQSSNLADNIARTLRKYDVPADRLDIEITESMLIADFEAAHSQIEKLRQMGIRIALDDFGTGYSSLSYLHRLEVDVLKIDRSFVNSLDKPQSRLIVQSIMTLAKTLNLRTVGEGVETLDHARFLRANGCNEMQGWLFSKSLRAGDFEEWLKSGVNMPIAAKIAVVQ